MVTYPLISQDMLPLQTFTEVIHLHIRVLTQFSWSKVFPLIKYIDPIYNWLYYFLSLKEKWKGENLRSLSENLVKSILYLLKWSQVKILISCWNHFLNQFDRLAKSDETDPFLSFHHRMALDLNFNLITPSDKL